jgi:hypothetical protein
MQIRKKGDEIKKKSSFKKKSSKTKSTKIKNKNDEKRAITPR